MGKSLLDPELKKWAVTVELCEPPESYLCNLLHPQTKQSERNETPVRKLFNLPHFVSVFFEDREIGRQSGLPRARHEAALPLLTLCL